MIQVPKFMDVYLNFTFFSLEKDRKCVYDNLKIYDGSSEQERLLATYCGNDALPLPVRSSGRNMLVVFKSDSGTVMKGFNATWVALDPSENYQLFLIPLTIHHHPQQTEFYFCFD